MSYFGLLIKHHDQKQLGKEKVDLTYISDHSPPFRSQAGMQEGTEVKTLEECCLLDCSLWLVQPSLLHLSGPPLERGTSSKRLEVTTKKNMKWQIFILLVCVSWSNRHKTRLPIRVPWYCSSSWHFSELNLPSF